MLGFWLSFLRVTKEERGKVNGRRFSTSTYDSRQKANANLIGNLNFKIEIGSLKFKVKKVSLLYSYLPLKWISTRSLLSQEKKKIAVKREVNHAETQPSDRRGEGSWEGTRKQPRLLLEAVCQHPHLLGKEQTFLP